MILPRAFMPFDWDEGKNRINQKKHGVSFETAVLVFDDPYALTQKDISHDREERPSLSGRLVPVRSCSSCM